MKEYWLDSFKLKIKFHAKLNHLINEAFKNDQIKKLLHASSKKNF